MNKKSKVVGLVAILIIANAIALFTISAVAEENQPQWPDIWIQFDEDPQENGKEYRDVHYAKYHINNNYLYFRLECYGYPNFTLYSKARYKWFIDIDNPYNMAQSGGNVYEQEYLLFIEDSLPAPNGDGIGDIFLLYDKNGDGFVSKTDWPNYLTDPGPILNTNIAGYRIEGKCMDIYLNQENISSPLYSYFTWSTDQGDPNFNSAPHLDRSDNYWDGDLSKADLSINKIDTIDPVYSGQLYSYILNVKNLGPHNSSYYNITDTLPEDVDFVSSVPEYDGSNDSTYWWEFDSLGKNETQTITINVIANNTVTKTITNNAQVYNSTRDPKPDNVADETTILLYGADLYINKTDSSDPVHYGGSFSYIIFIKNNGPHVALNCNVTDTLPEDVDFVSSVPEYDGSSDSTYWWEFDSLAKYETRTITINVTANVTADDGFTGKLLNTANVISDTDDPNSYNNSDTEETTIKHMVDLSIDKFDNIDPIYSGKKLSYTINVTNNGPNTAYDINITDILPDGVTYIDAYPVPNGSDLSKYWWNFAILNSSESIIIKVNVSVNSDTSGIITNNATVDSDTTDIYYENNKCSEQTTIKVYTPPGGGGGGGQPGGGGGEIYQSPTADAGGPYYGFIGEEIQFNGTKSIDNDEGGSSIEKYDWKFFEEDEWHEDLGNITTYIYNEVGVYNVSLRVYDDEDDNDINKTTVTILQPNRPPKDLTIQGETKGHQNISYTYEASATDPDGDNIIYTVDFDDGTIETSNPLPENTVYSIDHLWTNYGIYTITVSAVDEYNTPAESIASLVVLIDVHYVKDIGYLIDNDSDSIYDLFYSNTTGKTTITEQLDDDRYLIDSDEDEDWDWIYDIEDDTLIPYEEDEAGFDYLCLLLILLLIIIIIILILYYLKRKGYKFFKTEKPKPKVKAK